MFAGEVNRQKVSHAYGSTIFAWHPYVVAFHCSCVHTVSVAPTVMSCITLHSYGDLHYIVPQVEGEKTATGADKETFGTGVVMPVPLQLCQLLRLLQSWGHKVCVCV